ncbi:MAG: protein-L-isoaspartate O-methyltransferase [Gemmataceae bacterium]|nr:protein-L-isoaspartate O-methyltransferase [Gemmataceae bacterium]
MSTAADEANQQLVDSLIAEGALWSPALIAAFRATPRHHFLDRVFQFQPRTNHWHEVLTRDPDPEALKIVYADRALITRLSPAVGSQAPVPISSSSQPSLMSQMLEDLSLSAGLRILEIGAGTGYNSALMAHVVGPGRVTSIDVDRNVLSEAWAHLRRFPDRDVQLHHADGREGFLDAAPYDRILATAATPDVEPAWIVQMKEGGLLSMPLALAPGLAFILRGTVRDGIFDGRLLRAAYFMPLRTEGESGETADEGTWPAGMLERRAAPWGEWFDRRRARSTWLRFSQGLALYGLLHGLRVYYRGGSNGQLMYGVSDAADNVCWLGARDWEYNGTTGRDLGVTLWQTYRDVGAPWATEFRMRAAPRDGPPLTGGPEEYVRQGPRCRQVWQMIEHRERT